MDDIRTAIPPTDETVARVARTEITNLLSRAYEPGHDPEAAILADAHEYDLYFKQQEKMFGLLGGWYQKQENADGQNNSGSYEAQSVGRMLRRLLGTTSTLAMKYTYNPQHFLRVDLTNSGFPNFAEIEGVATDLKIREQNLNRLPGIQPLKDKLLDFMFTRQQESPELLAMLSERTYFQMLNPADLFLPFTPGELICLPDNRDGSRSYVFSWGCYDFKTNRPYLQIMTFTQDAEADPLENRGKSFAEFLEVIQGEGSRAPQLGVMATAIDDRLLAIHPKILKRICLGPLYSKFLMDNINDEDDAWFSAFSELMNKYSREEDDGILLFTDETIVSVRQEQVKRFLAGNRIREIYRIPEDDLEAYSRQASVVHHHALLPHYLLQEAQNDENLIELGFGGYTKISYTKGGKING